MPKESKRASVLADRIAKRLRGEDGERPKVNLANLANDLAERKAKVVAEEEDERV